MIFVAFVTSVSSVSLVVRMFSILVSGMFRVCSAWMIRWCRLNVRFMVDRATNSLITKDSSVKVARPRRKSVASVVGLVWFRGRVWIVRGMTFLIGGSSVGRLGVRISVSSWLLWVSSCRVTFMLMISAPGGMLAFGMTASLFRLMLLRVVVAVRLVRFRFGGATNVSRLFEGIVVFRVAFSAACAVGLTFRMVMWFLFVCSCFLIMGEIS